MNRAGHALVHARPVWALADAADIQAEGPYAHRRPPAAQLDPQSGGSDVIEDARIEEDH